jgi:hypothetical protein
MNLWFMDHCPRQAKGDVGGAKLARTLRRFEIRLETRVRLTPRIVSMRDLKIERGRWHGRE